MIIGVPCEVKNTTSYTLLDVTAFLDEGCKVLLEMHTVNESGF